MFRNHRHRNFQSLKLSQSKQLKRLSSRFEDTFVSDTAPEELEPDDRAQWYNRGDALANLGCYEEALTCFNKAVEIQPDNQEAWVFRSVVLIHLNRYEEALESCDKALEIQPNHKQAWMFRGAALHYLGRYKQAYASYDNALGTQKTSAWQKLTKMSIGLFKRLGLGH